MVNQITPNPSVPSQVVQEVKFPNFVNNLGIIPTSYKDSMSYYKTLTWLCKFLEETVIPTINKNGEAVEELQALYVELNSYVTHYFDTLDVQEEINNKLDDMVEAGTLQEIIAIYLNSTAIFGYNSVNEMKNSVNLQNGSYARTLGFYEKNDGGGALYKIRNVTNDDVVDNMFIIEMNDSENELIAELIIEKEISPLQVGAKGNNTDDDYSVLNSLINNENVNIIDLSYKIYNINSPIICERDDLTLKNGTLSFVIATDPLSNQGCLTFSASENILVKNVEITNNKYLQRPFYGESGYDDYIALRNITYAGFKVTNSNHITFENCKGYHCLCAGMVTGSNYINFINCVCYQTMGDGILISGASTNCKILNCTNIEGNDDAFSILGFNSDNSNNPSNCSIDNCSAKDVFGSAFTILSASNCSASNINGTELKYVPIKLGALEQSGAYSGTSNNINVSNINIKLAFNFQSVTATQGYIIDGDATHVSTYINLNNINIVYNGTPKNLQLKFANYVTVMNSQFQINIDYINVSNIQVSNCSFNFGGKCDITNCSFFTISNCRVATSQTSCWLVSGSSTFRLTNSISNQNLLSLYGLNGLYSSETNVIIGSANSNLVFTKFMYCDANQLAQMTTGSLANYLQTYGVVKSDGFHAITFTT